MSLSTGLTAAAGIMSKLKWQIDLVFDLTGTCEVIVA